MKKEMFAKATKAVKKKEQPEIKVSNELRDSVLSTLKRRDIKIIAESAIGDASDFGDYYILDTSGHVLFRLIFTPYTIRLLKGGELVGETHIVPIRDGLYDDIMIPDENMQKVTEAIYDYYNVYHTEYKGMVKTTPSRGR